MCKALVPEDAGSEPQPLPLHAACCRDAPDSRRPLPHPRGWESEPDPGWCESSGRQLGRQPGASSARSHAPHGLPRRLLLHCRSSKTSGQAWPVLQVCAWPLSRDGAPQRRGRRDAGSRRFARGPFWGGRVKRGGLKRSAERGRAGSGGACTAPREGPPSAAPWHLSCVTWSLPARQGQTPPEAGV